MSDWRNLFVHCVEVALYRIWLLSAVRRGESDFFEQPVTFVAESEILLYRPNQMESRIDSSWVIKQDLKSAPPLKYSTNFVSVWY
jgi:hypothetical protein